MNIPEIVIKRDGRKVPFNVDKIYNAIEKAFRSTGVLGGDEEINFLTSRVLTSLSEPEKEYSVEEIQDTVEKVLMHYGFNDIAKKYILYREQRTKARDLNSSLDNTFKEIINLNGVDSDLKRENANINSDAPMGMMLKIGSEASKQFTKKYLLRPEHAEMHDNGTFHIHDMDFYPMTLNCCMLDLPKLFKYGFCTGHGTLREPNSITTAAALTCIALQSNQNDMFGGQSIPTFEYDLAPYVVKSFIKHLIRYAKYDHTNTDDIKDTVERIYKKRGTVIDADGIEDIISFLGSEKAVLAAYQDTKSETYQAMEALIHNLNTMQSRAGAQTPFSSINYGTGTTAEQRLIIQMILKATDAGLGNGETPIFPVQIFKMKDGVNTAEVDPNYDLFLYSCQVTAKRLFPNYLFLDSTFNRQYYRRNQPETEVASMGCTKGSAVITVRKGMERHILSLQEFVQQYDYNDWLVWDSMSGKFVKVLNVIENPPETDWYRVRFTNGRYVDITFNHYLPVEGKGRTHTHELKPGDLIKKGYSFSGSEYWSTNCKDLDILDKYWLEGLIIRDGSYSASQISITLGLDEKELVDKAQLVLKNLGYETVVKEWHREEKGNYYEIRTKKAGDFARSLTSIFRGVNKVNRSVPKDICCDYNKARAFLAGMIDADGYVAVMADHSKVQLGTINEMMSQQTAMIADYLNLNPKVYVNQRTGRKAQYNVEFELDDKLIDALQCIKKKTKATRNRSVSIANKQYLKILSVEKLAYHGQSYCLTTESDTFDINGVCSHNCRTRVISNINGPEITRGRGNIAFITINLPRLGILSAGDIDIFYDNLQRVMQHCFAELLERYHYIAQKHVYNFPFLMGQQVWMDSEKLGPEDTIEPVLKHGTLSVGFIGLAEALTALTGKHHGESDDSLRLGLDIVRFMRRACDDEAMQTRLNFSLFATPAEGLSGRFVKIDKKFYGVIKGVTDKEYYTNSFHIPVNYQISVAEKLHKEGKFHEYCNAGAISYVEVDGNLEKNPDVIKEIVLYMKLCNVGYGSINHPVDRCPVCGYTGVINDTCPKCGRHDGEAVSVEKLRSLGITCY